MKIADWYKDEIEKANTVEELADLHSMMLGRAFGSSGGVVYMGRMESAALSAILVKIVRLAASGK